MGYQYYAKYSFHLHMISKINQIMDQNSKKSQYPQIKLTEPVKSMVDSSGVKSRLIWVWAEPYEINSDRDFVRKIIIICACYDKHGLCIFGLRLSND